MVEQLKDFAVQVELPLRWGEMDAYQHLNNTVYFRYFEDVRIKYFEVIGLHEVKAATNIAVILASTQCRFRLPLTYPDTIRVGARITKLESDRFVMEYSMVSAEHGKVAATGEGMLVAFDFGKGQKAKLPQRLVDAIVELEGEGLQLDD
jgi:acyl-CoA thioester hydrolase